MAARPRPDAQRRGGTWEGLRAALGGLLRDADGGASAENLADVLWVARLTGLDRAAAGADRDAGAARETEADARAAGVGGPAGMPPQTDGDVPGDAARPVPSAGADSGVQPEDEQETVAPPSAAGPRVGLHPYAAAVPAGPAPDGIGTGAGTAAAVHAVRVPQPPALSGALDLARALRPLRQSVEAPGAPLLDEEATAQASGEAGRGRLVPVWRPPARRRFSVDLLVDTGATMAVWHRLGAELCTLLERHGAFADVRCWSLDTDAAVPRLTPFRRAHPHGGPGPGGGRGARWAGALEDATGRRLLLVLTDGVGPAWYGTALPGFLARVAGERPAAALQVLPRRLWHRTALRTVPVELRVPDPARPAPAVRTDATLPGRPAPRSVRWLPVMEVNGAWLAPWAELVAGRAPGWSPMLAAPVRGVPRPRRAAAAAPPADAAERVARFRSGASPDAFRLACHLAAAPLSLPVMRLVQQATMPGSAQTDLAELFVSGLIARRDASPGRATEPGTGTGAGTGAGSRPDGTPDVDPDEVVYDFVPGVRDELLAELTRSESLRVLDDVLAKVSGRVAATFGGTLDFRALAVRVGEASAPTAPDGAGPVVATLAGSPHLSAGPSGASVEDARTHAKPAAPNAAAGHSAGGSSDVRTRADVDVPHSPAGPGDAHGAPPESAAQTAADADSSAAGNGLVRGGEERRVPAAGSALADVSVEHPDADAAAHGRILPAASLPFAEVAVAVLNGAGGRHRALAQRLAAAVEGRVPTAPRRPHGPAAAGPGPVPNADAARSRTGSTAESATAGTTGTDASPSAPDAAPSPAPAPDAAQPPAGEARPSPDADALPEAARDDDTAPPPSAAPEPAPGTGTARIPADPAPTHPAPAPARDVDAPPPLAAAPEPAPDATPPHANAPGADRTGRSGRAGRDAGGDGRASRPALGFPHLIVPVPRLRVPPDRAEMIGREFELAQLRELLKPTWFPPARPGVVVVEGRLGMGTRRLVQEYARRYGDQHSFVHWVDASRSERLHAGLSRLGAALRSKPGTGTEPVGQDTGPQFEDPSTAPGATRNPEPGATTRHEGVRVEIAETWRGLARHDNWLLVLDDLGPGYDLGDTDILPPQGRGVVLVTTTRLYYGRRRADAVITLEPLTRAEIADHVRRGVGPVLLARDERHPSVLNRLVARLSSLPAELAKVDVAAEFARELALAQRPGPTPLYRWQVDRWQANGGVPSIAGLGRDRLAVATASRPIKVYELSGGSVRSRRHNLSGISATALAALPDHRIGTGLAVAGDRPTVDLMEFPSGVRRFSIRADGSPAVESVAAEADADESAGSEAYGIPVERADGRIVTIRSAVTLLTTFELGEGRFALATGGPLPLRLWDASTGAAIPTGLTERVRSIRAMAAFPGPEGDPVLAVVTGAGSVQLWDVNAARRITSPLSYRLRGATSFVALRPAGRPGVLAVTDGGPVVRLWDTATAATVGELDTGALSDVVALGVLGSPRADTRLVTAEADGIVQVWDLGTFVEPPDPYASIAPYASRNLPAPAPASAADVQAAGDTPDAAAPPGRTGGAAPTAPTAPASDGLSENAYRHPLFVAWLVQEVSGRSAMDSDVLALLLGGQEAVDAAVAAGALTREGHDRVLANEARRDDIFEVTVRGAQRRRDLLVALLARRLPLPTPDVATWRPYRTLRPVLEREVQRLLSTNGTYADDSDAADVLGLITRWAWYLLLLGQHSAVAPAAERAVEEVEEALRRARSTSAADPTRARIDTFTQLRAQLNRISLRARLALGDGPAVTQRARAIRAAAPHGGDDAVEALLAEAEIALWRGGFDAPSLSAVARLRRNPPTSPRLEVSAASDDPLEQRRRLLLARSAMLSGRLGEAAEWLSLAWATATRAERRAGQEAAAESAERAASGGARPAEGTDPLADSSAAFLAGHPAVRSARLVSGAVDALAAEYGLIRADLASAASPPAHTLFVNRRTGGMLSGDVLSVDASRRRLWPYAVPSSPLPGTSSPQRPGIGIAVPDTHLRLYLALTQQYARLAVREEAEPLWGRSPEPRISSAPLSYDLALAAMHEVEPHVTRQRPLEFTTHTMTLGEVALIGFDTSRAQDSLAKARFAAEEAFGPHCPLLPRIGLLQAEVLHRQGELSAASDRLREVGALLYDLHGDAPHQDRVALLRAWATLERQSATADRLFDTADTMAGELAAEAGDTR